MCPVLHDERMRLFASLIDAITGAAAQPPFDAGFESLEVAVNVSDRI